MNKSTTSTTIGTAKQALPDASIEVLWQDADSITLQDDYLANWLLDKSSLTERLQSMCHNFAVELISHRVAAPRDDEIALLNCDQETTYIREVVLLGDGKPWVFARSVIPKAINDSELSELGNQPLGKRIFNDPRFSRGKFQVCQLDWQRVQTPLSRKTQRTFMGFSEKPSTSVYGRRSCFEFLGNTMSVAELFLPESPAYSNLR